MKSIARVPDLVRVTYKHCTSKQAVSKSSKTVDFLYILNPIYAKKKNKTIWKRNHFLTIKYNQ